jgi:hypothetical protein
LNTIDTFDQAWKRAFSDAPQFADRLRYGFPDRWVRFHSLPESKRYAESEPEYLIILSRHNKILDELAKGQRVILVTTGYSGDEEPKGAPERNEQDLSELDPRSQYWCSLALHELDDDPEFPNYWNLYISEWEWAPGVFNPILRLVADDAIKNVMIVSTDCSWLYHPYDGGADVVLSSTEMRDSLRERHNDWLSNHPTGL